MDKPISTSGTTPPHNGSPSMAGRPASLLRILRDIVETLLPAALIAILINLFLAQATRVYGQSMEPNLHSDERLVVEKISYRFHGPRRGDIVVLKLPERSSELLIKRVIALPGERIEIRDGYVFVDGVQLEEPYLNQTTPGFTPSQTVPPFHIFVLGDNRSASNDSRAFGPVPLSNIVGKAWVRYWPLTEVSVLE